jgi:CHAP domain
MPKSGVGNFFPKGQCTWWATNRYQQLTGKYVAWGGDAWSWANGARSAGWIVSSSPPPSNTPSIVVLAPHVQGAGSLGHVAVIESTGANGKIVTSNLNWAGNQSTPTIVGFQKGPGVQFVWYPGATRLPNAPPLPTGTVTSNSGTGLGAGNTPTTATTATTSTATAQATGQATPAAPEIQPLGLLAQVHNTLISHEGFYGIALAVDEAEQFPGWVNLATGPTDVIGICRSIGASIADNFPPVFIRGTLMLVGMLIFILLVVKVALPAVEAAAKGAEMIAPLLA